MKASVWVADMLRNRWGASWNHISQRSPIPCSAILRGYTGWLSSMRQGNSLQGSREGRQTSETIGVVREDKVASRARARGRTVVAGMGSSCFGAWIW